MTSMKLEDVESYLMREARKDLLSSDIEYVVGWLRNRFAELRAREEAKGKE